MTQPKDLNWHSFLGAPVGCIIRFDRFYCVSHETLHYDVWGYLDDDSRYLKRSVVIFTGECRGEHMSDVSDFGLVVSPSRVPKHIWAALAKWRLMGEVHDVA